MRLLQTTFTLFFLAHLSPIWSQVKLGNNLIPNPDFEIAERNDHRWYFKGSDFSESISAWYAPTKASPDLYKPEAKIPDSWLKKGFKHLRGQSGQRMIGLTVYGCKEGKPHCREYISAALKEPTIKGQRYRLDMWVKPMEGTIITNQMGVHFTQQKLDVFTDKVLEVEPLVEQSKSLNGSEWQLLRFFFVADTSYRFITIGNFRSDEHSKIDSQDPKWPFGYVYVDNLSLKIVPPLVSTLSDKFSDWYPIEKGQSFVLQKVFFDFDRHSVRDSSLAELDKLYQLLELYPDMEICIIGHTDNIGSSTYNQALSERRAESIRSYLYNRGIAAHRVVVKGLSYKRPVQENEDEWSRSQNRRVEIEIRKM